MKSLLLLLLLLAVPLMAQPPSPSPSASSSPEAHDAHDVDEEWTGHGHGHADEVEAGQEFTSESLHANSDNYPAIYKFMVREGKSEPFLVKGSDRLVYRDAAIVWGLNIALILVFYRRRR